LAEAWRYLIVVRPPGVNRVEGKYRSQLAYCSITKPNNTPNKTKTVRHEACVYLCCPVPPLFSLLDHQLDAMLHLIILMSKRRDVPRVRSTSTRIHPYAIYTTDQRLVRRTTLSKTANPDLVCVSCTPELGYTLQTHIHHCSVDILDMSLRK